MIQYAIHPSTQTAKPCNSGITEILMPYGEDLSMLLPMLASLSKQNPEKWFTWVVPKSFCKQALKSYDFAAENLRFIEGDCDDERLWMLWETLANGNSGYVVAFLDDLTEANRIKLEASSCAGQTRGMVLRNRK